MKKAKELAAQLARPEAVQMAMNTARKFVFKHMSAEHKARYLLRQAMNQLGGV